MSKPPPQKAMGNPTVSSGVEFPAVGRKMWRQQVEKELMGGSFEKALVTTTREGINLQPVYTEADWPHRGDPSGFPGLPPFTRGSRPVPAADGWRRCQRYNECDLTALNNAILSDVAGGTNALWLRFDRATRLGLDADSEGAADHIGQGGMSVYDIADLQRALDGLALDGLAITADAGANCLPVAAMVLAHLRAHHIDPSQLSIFFFADPLGVLARDGALPMSLQEAEREMALLAGYCHDTLAQARAVVVSTTPYHGAGAHAVQELAYGIATGVHYLRRLTEHGLSVSDAASQIAFSFAVGRDFFTELAKLRALRLLWGKVLAASGATSAEPMWLHAVTSPRTLTQRDAWVNMLRVTEQTFIAIIGGADSITSACFDEAIGRSDELGRRLARNTQLVLGEESYAGRVIDPAGGSWYVESLTEQLAERGWNTIQELERQGGMAECLLSGVVRAQVEETWKRRRSDLAKRKEAISGVSEFANVREEHLARPACPARTDLRDAAARAGEARSSHYARAAVSSVQSSRPEERIEACIAAAANGATTGQISSALPRNGNRAEITPLVRRRDSELFESLRDAVDAFADKVGRPTVFLANLATASEHKARATFAQNFFQAAGFEVPEQAGTDGAESNEAAAMIGARFAEQPASVACICGSDDRYAESAAPVARVLKQAGARRVLLAGRPGQLEETLKAAGVHAFIFLGCDVHRILSWLLDELKIVR